MLCSLWSFVIIVLQISPRKKNNYLSN